MTIAGLVVRIDDCEPMSAFDPERTLLFTAITLSRAEARSTFFGAR